MCMPPGTVKSSRILNIGRPVWCTLGGLRSLRRWEEEEEEDPRQIFWDPGETCSRLSENHESSKALCTKMAISPLGMDIEVIVRF